MLFLATSYDWAGQILILLAGWSFAAILLLVSIAATCLPKRRRMAKSAAVFSAAIFAVCLIYYGYLTLFSGMTRDSVTLYWIVGPLIGTAAFWTLNDYLLDRSEKEPDQLPGPTPTSRGSS